jgi:hypothetical protein
VRAPGRTAAAILVCWLAAVLPVPGAVLLSQEEALALAFPGAQVERRTAYLDAAQLAEARRLAGDGVPVPTALVPHYVARRDGRLVGAAYFDTHKVRTEAATVMYVIGVDDRLLRVEVIAFAEPPDYLPRPAWLQQFQARGLDADLALKRGIRPLTGASLTAVGITHAARRVLALHRVIAPLGGEPPAEGTGQRP